jgi:hypothetical protein
MLEVIHRTEVQYKHPFPLLADLLKRRQNDLANYIWEEDIDNIKKAEDDIRTYMFKLERGEVYEVPF